MAYTVASVPYINAIPLTARLELPPDPVHVLYDVPSRLPALLESKQADAILVSSIDALRVPGRRMAEGVCIGSEGPVRSVRLFSKVAPTEIQTLAFDASSMTSNRLAQVVLHDRYGAWPEVITLAPDLLAMLAVADAAVIIGDLGMMADGEGLYVLDLGEEWTDMTSLPFVWAAWIGEDNLTVDLAKKLNDAKVPLRTRQPSIEVSKDQSSSIFSPADEELRANLTLMVTKAAAQSKIPANSIHEYYEKVMIYDMDGRFLEGLREFQRRLLRNGFRDCCHYPDLVCFTS